MAQQSYETSDFYLACFLRCRGFPLRGMRREGRRALFQFEDRAGREQEVFSFFNNEASVRPLVFTAAIKDLKAMLHNV